MEKEELYKALDAQGIKYDKRWNARKLQQLVDDAVLGKPVEVNSEPVKRVPVPVLKVIATFKTRTVEGDRITHKYVGSGVSAEEALDLKCEDPEENEGRPWPRGCNCLVNLRVTRGDYDYTRALAPHVTRAILEERNIPLFRKLLGV